jgi:hypothetical protein
MFITTLIILIILVTNLWNLNFLMKNNSYRTFNQYNKYDFMVYLGIFGCIWVKSRALFLLMKGKLTIGKVKSLHLSYSFVFIIFICCWFQGEGQGKKWTFGHQYQKVQKYWQIVTKRAKTSIVPIIFTGVLCHCFLPFTLGETWLWSYGRWIYNYLCNQCLSPLKLWVRILFIMW